MKSFLNIFFILLFILSTSFSSAWAEDKIVLKAISPPNKLTKALSSSIWTSMSHDFKLDHKTQSPQVQKEIRSLLADQNKLYFILKSAAPYIYYIHQSTIEKGLPSEIALLPFIESEFNPNDHSTKGATGLWQLMPSTARQLGLKVRPGYDGRRNITASTRAALAHLKYLGQHYKGNWYLALAAYNCGEGRIQYARRHAYSNYFWDLSLPRETRIYVAKFLAIAEIIKNPKKYGVALPPIENTPYFTEVKIKKSVRLTQVASLTGHLATLLKLNPDYKHGDVPKRLGMYSLLVPIGVEKKLAAW